MGSANPLPKEGKFRLVEAVPCPVVPGPTRTKLPITEVIGKLNLRIAGEITAAVKDAAVNPGGILNLIRNMTVEATSSSRREVGKIKSLDFKAAYVLQQFLKYIAGENVLPGVPATGVLTAAAPYPISADVQLDFEFAHSESSRQTLLNTTELTSLYLNLDWGDANDVATLGAGGTVGFSVNPILKVSAEEYSDLQSKSHRYGINACNYIEVPIAGANTRLLIDLKRGYLLRGFMIQQFTRAGVYYSTPVDTVINSIALELNREVRKSFDDFLILQAQNQYDYHMAVPELGFAFIDLMPDGKYDQLIDTRRFRDVNVVLNVNAIGSSFVRIYPIEIIPSKL